MCIIEQDILGSDENAKKFLNMLKDKSLISEVSTIWEKQSLTSSLDRWNAFVAVCKNSPVGLE